MILGHDPFDLLLKWSVGLLLLGGIAIAVGRKIDPDQG